MLVDMIDKTIEILENNPDYRTFHLDSQSIVITDYLEIKPHMRERFINLVKDKRLLIGPWFILPEQFQVGGENLIRNLLIGHKICKEHGGVSKIGYSPFSWGQISQLPQIYKEFGIELIMFYRGINSLESPKAEFIWEGADGTTALASRFSTMPRYNFYFYIYRPVVHNETPWDIEHPWNKGGVLFHFADERLYNEDFFMAEYPDNYYPENIRPAVEDAINKQADDFTTPHVIWMEGHDSSGPNEKTVQIINDIRAEFPGINVIHSTLEDYAEVLSQSIDEEKASQVYGERRSAQYDLRSGNMYGYTTSARMYLKQRNFEVENFLQFYAEPFNSFAGVVGKDIKNKYLDIAWNLLVQNSAHDSIGGCSLDTVHEDMMSRYKQVSEISTGVFERACKFFISNIDHSGKLEKYAHADYPQFLTLFNPTTYTRDETVRLMIDIPDQAIAGSIRLINEKGETQSLSILESYDVEPVLEQMTNRPMYLKTRRYEVLASLTGLVPLGYTSFAVVPDSFLPMEVEFIASGKKKKTKLNNEFLQVTFNDNGTFNVFQKESGFYYNNLGAFYDEGEGGHAWVNKPLPPFVSTDESKAKVKLIENSGHSATVVIRQYLSLPSNLKQRNNRNPDFTIVPVKLFVTLLKGSRRVDMRVEVINKAESHRLRLMFPTGLKIKTHYGEGQFDVVERSNERPDTSDWVEQPMYDFPMHQFMAVSDGRNGAAIFTKGLKEYEVLPDTHNTIAITLLRSFNYVITPSSEENYSWMKGSQCLGKQEFELAFYPFKGSWSDGNVYPEAMKYNLPVSAIISSKANGDMPSTFSFLKIEPENLIFSCFKSAESENSNEFVLRVYNPTEDGMTGKVTFGKTPKQVSRTTLEEEVIENKNLTNPNELVVKIGAKKIKTYLIKY
ncbi:mannosylglycerate hydrolase [Ignavibacteriales bacterium]